MGYAGVTGKEGGRRERRGENDGRRFDGMNS